MEGIEAEMVLYKAEDENGRCEAEGKTQDIDQRIGFSALQVTQGDFEVVAQHGGCATRMLPAARYGTHGLLVRFAGRPGVRTWTLCVRFRTAYRISASLQLLLRKIFILIGAETSLYIFLAGFLVQQRK